MCKCACRCVCVGVCVGVRVGVCVGVCVDNTVYTMTPRINVYTYVRLAEQY